MCTIANKLQRLGQGAVLVQEAVEAFSQLPAAQYSTGWVLCCIGRAYYEMVDYPQAARVFEWARQVDPTRLEVWPLSPSSSPWVPPRPMVTVRPSAGPEGFSGKSGP